MVRKYVYWRRTIWERVQNTLQPRSQAFPSCGGKTLVQAGHVTPRFLEITKIRD